MNEPRLYLFTSMKDSERDDHIWNIQYNALMSWLALPVEIFKFGSESEEMAEEAVLHAAYHGFPGKVIRLDHPKLNEHGTPLISPMFQYASDIVGPGKKLMYVNADIILLPHKAFFDLIHGISGEYLAIGRRVNFDQRGKLDFADINWRYALEDRVRERGYAAVSCAIDYFLHTTHLWQNLIPEEMALARFHWDNHLPALVGTARRKPVIDISLFITAIHQDHPPITSFDAPEAKRNAELSRGMLAGLDHATHHLNEDGFLQEGRLEYGRE